MKGSGVPWRGTVSRHEHALRVPDPTTGTIVVVERDVQYANGPVLITPLTKLKVFVSGGWTAVG